MNIVPNVFVASAGTGGTIGGVSARLKHTFGSTRVKTILADPPGSGLCNKINHGTLFSIKDREGYRIRHPIDTIVEGVGLNRLTSNFKLATKFIDSAFEISDAETVEMANFLLKNEGLFLGSSSALNCACIIKAVKTGDIKPGDTVVTILCDSGMRHISKFWNLDYLQKLDLHPK